MEEARIVTVVRTQVGDYKWILFRVLKKINSFQNRLRAGFGSGYSGAVLFSPFSGRFVFEMKMFRMNVLGG